MHPTPQGVVLTPVSPAVAKLLHELQAQIIREADEAKAGTPAGAIVLEAPRYTEHTYNTWGHRVIESKGPGGSIWLQTPFVPAPEHAWQRPGVWYGSESRRDALGREWQRSLSDDYVTDDFGTLVPVPEGGAA